MSMEIFVSCLGDLATLVGSVLFVTSAGHPLVLFFSLSLSLFFFSARPWGVESFTMAIPLHSGRVEFLRCDDRSKARERSLSGQILG